MAEAPHKVTYANIDANRGSKDEGVILRPE